MRTVTNKVTTLDQDLTGHRRRGIDVWEYNSAGYIIKRLQIHEPQIGNYITSLLPLPGGAMAVGTYGQGVSIVNLHGTSDTWKPINRIRKNASSVSEPRGAVPPTRQELAALYHNLLENKIPSEYTSPQIIPITDDWRTEGNWEGNYGRYCMWLFSYIPTALTWCPVPGVQRLKVTTGPHCDSGNDVRFYQHGWTRNQSLRVPVLYMKMLRGMGFASSFPFGRSEAQLDDHGEVYPMSWQGPDLYVYLHIPPGVYTLSLYFLNKDGHSGDNRDRDYAISMIPVSAGYRFGSELCPNTAPLARMRGTAQSRVVNFWGGVWKRFLVRGPMKLAIRVDKNYSLNTTLDGVSLDFINEHPFPYYYGHRAWQIHEKQRVEFRTHLIAAWQRGQASWHRHPADGACPPVNRADTAGLAMAHHILQIMNLLEHRNPTTWTANEELAYTEVLRWCVASYGEIPKNKSTATILGKCYFRLGMFRCWAEVENHLGCRTPLQIDESLPWDGINTNFLGLEYDLIRKAATKITK